MSSNSKPSPGSLPALATAAQGVEADDDNQSDNSNTSSSFSGSSSSNNNNRHRGGGGGPEAALNHLMKSLQHQASRNRHNPSESGSSNGGNNSDNSALVSLGNTSFGFNFDSDERFSNNDSKEGSGDSNTDSDGNEQHKKAKKIKKLPKSSGSQAGAGEGQKPYVSVSSSSIAGSSTGASAAHPPPSQHALQHEVSSLTMSSTGHTASATSTSAVAITSHKSSDGGGKSEPASSHRKQENLVMRMDTESDAANVAANAMASIAQHQYPHPEMTSSSDRKRKVCSSSSSSNIDTANSDGDGDSGGYNTDDDERNLLTSSSLKKTSKRNKPQRYQQQETQNTSSMSQNVPPPPPPINNPNSSTLVSGGAGGGAGIGGSSLAAGDGQKREERNQREKERSYRIAKQITELRDLLSSGGVVVPKGTKSSVLTEAAKYIRTLQQHQYLSEIDRHQLVQQMQVIGSGAHGSQAAEAIRHFAAQNGVWSLGNFGGVPPKSAMTPFYNPAVPQQAAAKPNVPTSASSNPLTQIKIEPSEYRFIFNACGVGIAIASMGGAFIDCNHLFSQLSDYTKQELCSLTIFNLTARQDLQTAFDQISQLISPPLEEAPSCHDATSASTISTPAPKPIVLRGCMKSRDDLGMSISLVRGDDGIAKCFCVTLIRNPASPFDMQRPVPVSYNAILAKKDDANDMKMAPAFTSG